MGANPLRKDIFVQIDSMVGGGFDHRPDTATLKPVVDAFAARGIALIVLVSKSVRKSIVPNVRSIAGGPMILEP